MNLKDNYIPVYRCLLCNQIVYGRGSICLSMQETSDLISQQIRMESWGIQNNPALSRLCVPMRIVHNCAGGHSGIAHVAGCQKL